MGLRKFSTIRKMMLITASVSATALAMPARAGAEDQAAAPPPSAAEAGNSEEIVVTAQRREQRLQDVPISITAVSPLDAKRFSIVETKNLQFITPGLTFPEDNGTINPYIRGRGTNFSGPGLEGSVAIYVDDVYLQTQFGSAGLVDVSQLQVLKGPQGTLYGRNATGGAILITTADPTLGGVEGHVEVGYGSLNTRHGEAVINLPVADTLAFRFAAATDNRRGFVRNVVNGQREGAASRRQFRGKMLWEPSSDFRVLAKAEYQKMDADYLRSQVIDGTNAPTGLGFYQSFRSPIVPKAGGGENDVDVWSGSIKLSYTADAFNVTNVAGYRRTKITSCSDNDNIFARTFDFCPQLPGSTAVASGSQIPNRLSPDAPATVPAAYDKTFTNDARLTTTFDGNLNILLGANYQRTRARFAAVLVGDAFGPLIPVFDNFIKIRNWAVYGEVYFKPTDQLTITAGGRYSRDDKSIRIFNNADVGLAFGVPAAFLPSTVFQKDHWSSFTPRVVVSYDTGPANFYVSYSAGFKSGGFNAPSIFPQTPLSPEKIDGFEAGAKLRLLDNRLWLDVAAFHTKTKDIQVAAIDTSIGSVVQQNAASAKADGAEANFRFKPNDALILQAGVAYLDSHFTNFPNASVFNVAFNPLFGRNLLGGFVEDLKGFPTTLSPKWTMNGAATYEFPLVGEWSGSVTLSARHSSSYDFQAGAGGPQRYARQKSFTVVNLTGFITPPGERLQISWYVNNLFRQHYYDQLQTNSQTGSLPNGGGVYGVQALPRTYGASVRVNF